MVCFYAHITFICRTVPNYPVKKKQESAFHSVIASKACDVSSPICIRGDVKPYPEATKAMRPLIGDTALATPTQSYNPV